MTSRLPKSSIVALSLTVAVTAMAAGGSAYAQTGNQPGTLTGRAMLGILNASNPGGPTPSGALSPGGSLRNAPASDFTDQAASDNASAEPATDEAPSADDPQAEADEGETGIRRSQVTYDSDPAEPE